VKPVERRIQLKLVAVANIELKVGQEIDATITLSDNNIFTAELEKGLVVMAHQLLDPQEPTGYWARLGQRPQG